MLFFVAHLVDDELLVLLNLMEYLGTTLLHIKRTSMVLVLDLVLRVVLVGLVVLRMLMHILVSGYEIRFISDVVVRCLLNHLRGDRWTHVLEGRIWLSVEAVRSPWLVVIALGLDRVSWRDFFQFLNWVVAMQKRGILRTLFGQINWIRVKVFLRLDSVLLVIIQDIGNVVVMMVEIGSGIWGVLQIRQLVDLALIVIVYLLIGLRILLLLVHLFLINRQFILIIFRNM